VSLRQKMNPIGIGLPLTFITNLLGHLSTEAERLVKIVVRDRLVRELDQLNVADGHSS
jgi:hypothetical protein